MHLVFFFCNLSNTKLVVLSACETGLGETVSSEGVFGLQRSLKLAGVDSIIMSLWKVDDNATAEFMKLFYEKWLSGSSRRQAFSFAQKQIKEKKEFAFTSISPGTLVKRGNETKCLSDVYEDEGLDSFIDSVSDLVGLSIDRHALLSLETFPKVME